MSGKKVKASLSSTMVISSDTVQGFLKKGNFLNRYSKKYFMIVDNYLYYGKTKQAVMKKINLREAYIEKEEKSKTHFKIVYNKGKLKLKA